MNVPPKFWDFNTTACMYSDFITYHILLMFRLFCIVQFEQLFGMALHDIIYVLFVRCQTAGPIRTKFGTLHDLRVVRRLRHTT